MNLLSIFLIAIADYADIKDYVLYEGEEEDDPDTDIGEDDITPENIDDDLMRTRTKG